MSACPVGGARGLTDGEKEIARSIFGSALDLDVIALKRRRWFPLQPVNTLMAPTGHIHVAGDSTIWRNDYSKASLSLQGLLLHELTHVWQAQRRGRFWLVLMRHPFCHYGYAIHPGRPLDRYGIEQQAEIVRHVYLLRRGFRLTGAPPLEQLESILPFFRE